LPGGCATWATRRLSGISTVRISHGEGS
jgi:hypothetical protein